VSGSAVFCAGHWGTLPRAMRDEIYAAKAKPWKHQDAVPAAIKWLGQQGGRPITRADPTMTINTDEFVEKVACIAHEANRAYCKALGD
jgi:hypothetical protein